MKRTILLLVCLALTLGACSQAGGNSGRSGAPSKRPTFVKPGDRTVVFTPPETRKVLGDLRVPTGTHHDTPVVLVHGGGGFLGDREEERAWQDLYARSGYVTLSVDYFIFNDSTPAPVYPQPESDVKAAVQYLRRRANELAIDPNRIVVHGFSAGARIGAQLLVGPDDPALEGDTHWPSPTDRIAGLIGFYGYYDGYQFQPDRYYGGRASSSDPSVRARWKEADSDARAAAATGPVLLFHGDADPLPVSQSMQFADALRVAGGDVDLVVVPGATHGFDIKNGKLTPAGQLAAHRVLDWLGRHFE